MKGDSSRSHPTKPTNGDQHLSYIRLEYEPPSAEPTDIYSYWYRRDARDTTMTPGAVSPAGYVYPSAESFSSGQSESFSYQKYSNGFEIGHQGLHASSDGRAAHHLADLATNISLQLSKISESPQHYNDRVERYLLALPQHNEQHIEQYCEQYCEQPRVNSTSYTDSADFLAKNYTNEHLHTTSVLDEELLPAGLGSTSISAMSITPQRTLSSSSSIEQSQQFSNNHYDCHSSPSDFSSNFQPRLEFPSSSFPANSSDQIYSNFSQSLPIDDIPSGFSNNSFDYVPFNLAFDDISDFSDSELRRSPYLEPTREREQHTLTLDADTDRNNLHLGAVLNPCTKLYKNRVIIFRYPMSGSQSDIGSCLDDDSRTHPSASHSGDMISEQSTVWSPPPQDNVPDMEMGPGSPESISLGSPLIDTECPDNFQHCRVMGNNEALVDKRVFMERTASSLSSSSLFSNAAVTHAQPNMISKDEKKVRVPKLKRISCIRQRETSSGHKCGLCSLEFKLIKDKKRHLASVHKGKKFPCKVCGRELSRYDNLLRHERKKHMDLAN